MDEESSTYCMPSPQCALKPDDSRELLQLILDLSAVCAENNLSKLEHSYERFICVTNLYQLQPQLLDRELNLYISNLISHVKKAWHGEVNVSVIQPFMYLCHLAKTRGPKIFINRLPHDVEDFEFVLSLLKTNESSEKKSWEVRYVSLLWLTLLCKLPFSFSLLMVPENGPGFLSPNAKLVQIGIDIIYKYADKSREVACLFISEVLSRITKNDEKVGSDFQLLDTVVRNAVHNLLHENTNIRLASLVLLCSVFKRLSRVALIDIASSTLACILQANLDTSKEIMLRKLATKLIQRVGSVLLKPRNIEWLYKKQTRLLCGGDNPMKISSGSASNGQNLSTDINEKNDSIILKSVRNYEESATVENIDLLTKVESVVEYLGQSLKDRDTVVRWSAAKGIGRIAAKLSFDVAREMITVLLMHFDKHENDASWHGACLALAELGRRGCLLPAQLPLVLEKIIKALSYDKVMTSYSVGAHVRDAGWSFARAFTANDLISHVRPLANALIIVSLFDSEIKCRRAASAAFQELVGRLPNVFGHGLEIVAIIDYFSVGNINDCYEKLSVEIGQLNEYKTEIFDHLVKVKLNHYDLKIRKLAAAALRQLSAFRTNEEFDRDLHELQKLCVAHDSFARSGALLALSRIITTDSKPHLISNHMPHLISIPEKLVNLKLLEGIGGDVTRLGLIVLMKNLLQFVERENFPENLSMIWYKILFTVFTLDENAVLYVELWESSMETMEILAQRTLYCNDAHKLLILSKLLSKIELGSSEVEKASGAAGLSCFAPYLVEKGQIQPYLSTLLRSLSDKSHVPAEWVNFRSTCLKALVKIAEESTDLSEEHFRLILNAVLLALEDFTTSSKGDIGKVVRQTAILSVVKLISLAPSLCYIGLDLLTLSVCKLLETCFDKIETLEKASLNALKSILSSRSVDNRLKSLLHHMEEPNSVENFKKLAEILALPIYSKFVLRGLMSAIGLLTESITTAATKALLGYVSRISSNDEAALEKFVSLICSVLDELSDTKTTEGNRRMITPVLKTLDILFASNYLENYQNSEDLEKIFNFVVSTSSNSTNKQRLSSSSNFYCSMQQFSSLHDHLVRRSLRILTERLLHKYPFVRSKTASCLYEALLMYGQLDNHSECVLSLLCNTDWLKTSLSELRDTVDELTLLLRISN